MKKILLTILLLINGLLNAQNSLLFSDSKTELNTNPYFDFSYTNLIPSASSDFTTDGTAYWTAVEVTKTWDASGFMTFTKTSATINKGLWRDALMTAGHIYNVSLIAKSSNSTDKFNSVGDNVSVGTVISNPNFTTLYQNYSFIISPSSAGLRMYTNSTTSGAIVDLDNIVVKELVAPTGWTSATMTVTDYVIEDSGCKFVEVTGETYIQMSDTLEAGYYKLKVTQDWTQGQLWAYNGTTTYNFPQSDGSYAVKIYLDGNEPLVIGCDNNTISILSRLSIK